MIVVRSPFRLSFVGGGSDLPSFFERHPGCVLSTAIDKYIYLNIHQRFEEGYRIAYSQVEDVALRDQISHPIVRNALKIMSIDTPLEITSIADIPGKGTGLGSSSSFAVGLATALSTQAGIPFSKMEAAEMACKIEIEMCGEPIGKQDQYAAAIGDYNVIHFFEDGNVKVEPLILDEKLRKDFEDQWVIVYTGATRAAGAILSEQSQGMTDVTKFETTKTMASLVPEFNSSLLKGDFEEIGRLLNENWKLKRSLQLNISNELVDGIYETGMAHGAIGGKLLGAGAGGFVFLLVPVERRESVVKSLKEFRLFNFRSDRSGAKVIYESA